MTLRMVRFPTLGVVLVSLFAGVCGPGCADRGTQVSIALPATTLLFSAVYVGRRVGGWP